MNKKRGISSANQSKKAQAALEFLMTYGWAILVVLVVIGTLAYFGILNPSFLLPEKCTMQMGLYCKDHRIDLDKGSISLKLENGMGKGIIVTRLKISDQKNLILCDVGIGPFNGENDKAGCSANPLSCTACGNFSYDIIDRYYYTPFNKSLDGSTAYCNPHENFRDTFNGYAGWHIKNTDDGTITVPCQSMTQNEGKTKVDIVMLYFFDDSTPEFLHTMEGELLAKIETIQI